MSNSVVTQAILKYIYPRERGNIGKLQALYVKMSKDEYSEVLVRQHNQLIRGDPWLFQPPINKDGITLSRGCSICELAWQEGGEPYSTGL